MSDKENIAKAYAAFNNRNIDAALEVFHPDVNWPNGWKGGYVHGHEEVRNYWTSQWKEINPIVTPSAFTVLSDGRIEVTVKQAVKDIQGALVFDGYLKHVFEMENGLVRRMEIIS